MVPMQWFGEPGFVLLVLCGGFLVFVVAVAVARQVWDGPPRPPEKTPELTQAAKERIVRELQREMRYKEMEAEVARLKAEKARGVK